MAERGVAQGKQVLALVDDLFFILKMEDTAKHLGLAIRFAASAPEFFERLRNMSPALVIVDLTMAQVDMAALLHQLTSETQHAGVPVLGYTTHADWKRTVPLHTQCSKVITKDVLSRHLPDLMQQVMKQD